MQLVLPNRVFVSRRIARLGGAAATMVATFLGLSAIDQIPSSATVAVSAPAAAGAGEFDVPSGLAFGDHHLWVTNQAGNSVTEIDPSSGKWLNTFRGAGYGFNRPTAITATGSDLVVANAAGSITELRATDGSPIRSVGGPSFGFADPVALGISGHTVLVLNAGRPTASPAIAGSLTEVDVRTGQLIRRVSGKAFALDDPVALSVSGPDVFVADEGDNSVTEVRVTTGRLVRVVSNEGLNGPDGLAIADGHVWVADSKSDATTEINASTGEVLANLGDEDAKYGFGSPSVAITSAGNIFIASPFGTSPMVTKLSAANGAPSWYMCNTNGPYYFSLLSAFAVSGDHLWVASRSGANSKTPGAKSGSLTELNTGSGALITTLPTN